jgi:dolichyl-phosphate beta-glucosyltransferase
MPCFNEALRFRPEEALKLLSHDDVGLMLVNDGSTDNTAEVLDRLAAAQPDRVQVLHLGDNVGKAEAVRAGMGLMIDQGARIAGYLDADFATPAEEMLRLISIFETQPATDVLLGSRWLHLGADIERKPMRHYGGRLFATLASQVLDLKVYDTQCGAKLFRGGEVMRHALSSPFASSWAFDVELIGRLRQKLPESAFLEVPLNRWIDVHGSKITFFDMISATLSLVTIRSALAIWRKKSG